MTIQIHFEPNYFSLAEQIWQLCNGQTRVFSPLDWAYLAAWEDHRISIEAVALGIMTTFENRAKLPPERRAQPIKHLSYCSAEVFGAEEWVREMTAQGHDPRPSLRRRFFGEPVFHLKEKYGTHPNC